LNILTQVAEKSLSNIFSFFLSLAQPNHHIIEGPAHHLETSKDASFLRPRDPSSRIGCAGTSYRRGKAL